MSWEIRNGHRYYYKSRKVNGKVTKEYYGSGITAELIAAADAERKCLREQIRIERERAEAIDRQITEFCQAVDGIALGLLVSQGYYRHKGNHSDWRKRRGFKPFMNLQISEEKTMTLNTDKMATDELRENLQQLVQQGETGNTNAILALQPVVKDVTIYDHAADLGKEVKSNLTFYMASGDPTVQEKLLTEMALRTTAFLDTVSASSPFEQHLFGLLAEEMEICRIQSRHADVVNARYSPQEPQQKRQERAHKRYQNAIKTTAQVHKLLKGKPSVQVNLAQNQIVA